MTDRDWTRTGLRLPAEILEPTLITAPRSDPLLKITGEQRIAILDRDSRNAVGGLAQILSGPEYRLDTYLRIAPLLFERDGTSTNMTELTAGRDIRNHLELVCTGSAETLAALERLLRKEEEIRTNPPGDMTYKPRPPTRLVGLRHPYNFTDFTAEILPIINYADETAYEGKAMVIHAVDVDAFKKFFRPTPFYGMPLTHGQE